MNAGTITKITVTNFMNLVAVSLTPDGEHIEITGKNKAGKTSLATAIEVGFKGRGAVPADPVHGEAHRAVIVVETDKYIIRREIKPDRSVKFTLTAVDGSPTQKPQAILDAFLGDIGLDPLGFNGMKDKEQFDTLMRMVELKPDWGKFPIPPLEEKEYPLAYIDGARTGIFDERADVKKDVTRLSSVVETQQAEIPEGAHGTKAVSVSELIVERGAANKIMSDNDTIRADIARMGEIIVADTDTIDAALEIIEQKQKVVSLLKESIDTRNRQITECRGKIIQNDQLPDIKFIDTKIAAAEETNKLATKLEVIKDNEAELETLRGKVVTLTDTLKEIDEFKADTLAACKMPVDGLGIGDGFVTHNGHPLKTGASGAQQIAVSMEIAMAMSPECKVIVLDDAQDLDSDMRKVVLDTATENGYQVIMLAVDHGQGGVVITDGVLSDENNGEG